MKNTPVDYQTARKIIDGYGLPDFGKATIREVVAISTQLEQETKTEFIHMEMGVPGLKAAQVGVDAEIKALQDGVASIYPNINGTSDVKAEASRFIIYRYRYCAGRLRSRNRLHAGDICIVSRLRTMYAGKGHDSLYRSGVPCPEAADHSHGL